MVSSNRRRACVYIWSYQPLWISWAKELFSSQASGPAIQKRCKNRSEKRNVKYWLCWGIETKQRISCTPGYSVDATGVSRQSKQCWLQTECNTALTDSIRGWLHLLTDSSSALTALTDWAPVSSSHTGICFSHKLSPSQIILLLLFFDSGRIYLSFNIFVLSRVLQSAPVVKLSHNSEMAWKIKMTWSSSI